MTSLEAINIIYTVIQNSVIVNAISGDVHKFQKPANSTKEEMVINGLSLNEEQLQEGILNANLYVPDIEIKQGKITERLPATKRYNELLQIIYPVLKEVWGAEWSFKIQQQNLLIDPRTKEYFYNLRIEFNSENF